MMLNCVDYYGRMVCVLVAWEWKMNIHVSCGFWHINAVHAWLYNTGLDISKKEKKNKKRNAETPTKYVSINFTRIDFG